MDSSLLQNLQPYLFLIIGIVLIIYAIFKKSKSISNGEKAEGIIFELKGKGNYDLDATRINAYNIVIIRFVTKKLEWITAEVKNDFASFYSGQYKIGEKVEVLYDTNNPNNFILLTKQSETRTKLILIAISIVFILIGIFQLLKIHMN